VLLGGTLSLSLAVGRQNPHHSGGREGHCTVRAT